MREEWAEGVAQHLATLVEGCFYDLHEEIFVASERCSAVAREAHDSALHLWLGYESGWRDGEEVFGVVPCLKQDREYAASAPCGGRGEASRYFFLEHSGEEWD